MVIGQIEHFLMIKNLVYEMHEMECIKIFYFFHSY